MDRPASRESLLLLLRHGETEWSRTGRHTGRTDVPLTPAGEERARQASALLAGRDFGLVLSSPLTRARETARLAGVTPDETVDDLLEWDYGAWEGRTTPEIRAELGDEDWTIWSQPIPRGDTPGEQPEDVAARTRRVIARCLPVLAGGRDCLLVAHGHVLRILASTWLGLPAVDGRLLALDAGAVSALGHEHDTRVVRWWNAPG